MRLIFFFSLAVINLALGQYGNRNWYFGNRAGIHFNKDGSVRVLTDGLSNVQAGNTTLSDSLGNLVFYSDGQTIWNRTHAAMDGGTNIVSSPNAIQTSSFTHTDTIHFIASPDPNSKIVQLTQVFSRRNGGDGLARPFASLSSNLTHKIAITAPEKNRVWMMMHKFNSDEFYRCAFTAAGLVDSANIAIGNKHGSPGNLGANEGEMTFNLTGDRLAVLIAGDNDSLELFDFDYKTGTLSNPQDLTLPLDGANIEVIGVEFSPSGDLLYISLADATAATNYLYQYDLTASTITNVLIGTNAGIGGLQLGANGKIYVAMEGTNFLGRIEHPNLRGTAANFSATAIDLTRPSGKYLPNVVKTNIFTFDNPCATDPVSFRFVTNDGIDSIEWNFGDASSSTSYNPLVRHSYTAAGTYDVRVKVYYENDSTLTQTQRIQIYNTLGATLNPIANICQLAAPINLSGSPAGGRYVGKGVNPTTGEFNPQLTTLGKDTIHYVVTNSQGCADTASRIFEVTPDPNIIFAAIATFNYCINTAPFLFNVANPPGGDYVGVGIDPVTNIFNPRTAGIGTHSFTYTIRENGCTKTERQGFNILALPTVKIGNDTVMCDIEPSFTIVPNIAGGEFSGSPAVDKNTGVFNPATALKRRDTVIYTYTDANNCSNSDSMLVEVFSATPVAFNAVPNQCTNQGLLTLNTGTPTGGVYSGAGVDIRSSTFSPSIAGVGRHTLTYTFTNPGGCISNSSVNVQVNNPTTTTLNALPDVCVNDANFLLTGGAPAGGSYFGRGVNGGRFFPNVAGAGLDTVYYTFRNFLGCPDTASRFFEVKDTSRITLTRLPTICINSPATKLDFFTPTGGTYTGIGIDSRSSTLTPAIAGLGTHSVSYSFTNFRGCVSKYDTLIEITALPVVNIAALPRICNNGIPISLTQGTPAGGVYSGGGVTGSSFNPKLVTAGFRDISYEVTSGIGCSNKITRAIEVITAPTAVLNLRRSVFCVNESPLFLAGGTPNSGYYIGRGIDPVTNIFRPATLDTGRHQIGFVVSNGTCNDTAFQNIYINDLPQVELGADTIGCTNAPVILDGRQASHDASTRYLWSTGATTPTISVSNIGNNTITLQVSQVKRGLRCNNTDNIDVLINPAPFLELGADQKACIGDEITVNARHPSHRNIIYQWNTGQRTADITFRNIINREIIVTATDTVLKCAIQDTLQVSIADFPQRPNLRDTVLCSEDLPFNFDASTPSHSPNTVYLWNTGAKTKTLTVKSQIGLRTYNVVIRDTITGCSINTSFDLSVSPKPQITLRSTPFLNVAKCETDLPLTLTATRSGFPYRYSWNTGETSRTITINTTSDKLYKVLVTDTISKCHTTDSVQIKIFPRISFDLGKDTTICESQLPFDLKPTALPTSEKYSFQWNTGATTETIKIRTPSNFKYRLRATGQTSGCTFEDSVSINILPKPTIALPSKLSFCLGNNKLNLDARHASHAGLNLTYLWSNGSTNPVLNLEIDSSFKLYLEVGLRGKGCTNRDSVAIVYDNVLEDVLPRDTFFCSDVSIFRLSAFSPKHLSTSVSYLWNTGAKTPAILVDLNREVAQYWVETKDRLNNCKRLDTITVRRLNPPRLNLIGDTTLCRTDLSIDARHPTHSNMAKYLWSSGANTPNINVNHTGTKTYTVTVIDNFCTTTGSVQVNMLATPLDNLPRQVEVCQKDIPLLLLGKDPDHGLQTTYLWQKLGQTTALTRESTLAVTTAGDYLLTTTDTRTSCQNIDTVTVDIVSDIEYTIQATPNRSYPPLRLRIEPLNSATDWYFKAEDGTERELNSNSSFVDIDQYGLYLAKVKRSSPTCEYTLNFRVYTKNPNIAIPNAMTPNGDGKNDYFAPITQDLTALNISILDYEGSLIFRRILDFGASAWNGVFEEKLGWDGTNLANKPVPVGKYLYKITYQWLDTSGKKISKQKTGFVNVIR